MTDKEKKDIIDAVLLQIQNNSQSVDTLQLADSLNGVSSLPCVKGEELVSVPLSLFEKIVSDTAASSASGAIIEETNARISADANLQAQITETKDGNAELLKRIIGKSTASSAYNDPFKYLKDYQSEKDENGTITKNAILVMQDALLDTLRHSDYSESFPYIGHMRAHIEGVPIEMWNYVKTWNEGSTNGVFVQVVRTNFGLKNGVISYALTSEFHEYFRTVTVSMVNGSVTDVTATAWKESTVTTEQAKKLNIITYLGHYSTRDALLAAAAKINVVQLSSDNSVRILYGTYTEGSTNSVLILQHNTRTGAVSESGRGTTMQYVFDGKERYTRYIDHNASSVTAVQPLQREGVRNLYFTPKGFIGLRDMWGTQVGSGFFLPDNTAIREDAANTTATSVGLIITSFLGTTKTATLGAVTSARAGLMTVALYNELKQATAGVAAEETARAAADAELLKRIIGKSTASSAYTDPFKYIGNFASEKDESGTVTKNAILVMQDALLDTLRHSDYSDSFPYIGHMRAHIEGVPIEMWTYVKAWNTGSTNGVFVQVVRTNFGLKNGVISSALTSEFHEYHREVTVAMSDGNVTDVTATVWKEITADIRDMADEGISKADAALSQIHEERQERSSQDRVLSEAVSQERAARTAADAELQAKISETRENTAAYLNQLKEKVDANTESINAETEARTTADAELQAKIQDHEDRICKLENQWYGIEWDTEVSSPAVTRIGNMDLHRTLPIQSRMRGCLLDDNGKVVKYLNPKDWTGEVRDGSRGQVMVEIPMHYRRCETEGTKRRVKLSEYHLPGFLPIPLMYPSAYEASLQRSTNKLCSVVNTDPDFRGGNNNAAWDGTYRSLLGRPATVINLHNFRTYARNRNNAATSEWNLYTYHVHKALYWLYVVEYANRNSQLPFTAKLTEEGFHQGGLGAGVSNLSGSDWLNFNGYYPFVPCGHTDILGNSTGVVAYTAYNADGSELKTSNVPRYRGIENPFGHIWKWTDGCECIIQSEASGALSKFYVCDDPAKFTASGVGNYDYRGDLPRKEGYVKALILGEDGEIMPLEVGGGSTTYFCDYFYTNIPSSGEAERGVLFGGTAHYGAAAGFVFANADCTPAYADANAGSRLCFIPSE